jgi:mono/diheme cytochrome c family protein
MAAGSIRLFWTGVLLTVAVVVVEAGGWVVITVTDLPDYVVVEKPVTLTYAVRQHGMHLLGGLTGRIEARAGINVVRAPAVPTSELGHYSATFTLPYGGDWTVDILSGFSGQLNGSRITLKAVNRGRPAPTVSEQERGQRLFVAKGCITCHVHGAVDGRSTSAGPALTAKRYQAEYLKRFLAHPPQAEPAAAGRWQMPDLMLHERDIVSLMAFITAKPPGTPEP